MRLDIYLVERGICGSREKAKDLILKGRVRVNGSYVNKPSFIVDDSDEVDFEQEDLLRFVSKGGLKLEKAITEFDIDFSGKNVMDIGASTGGFTDCALQHGAKFVWAVDVGSNQLDARLQGDPRICSLEHTDFRQLEPSTIGIKLDAVIGDLSFISLVHIIQRIPLFLADDGFALLLIKPQFEVGPGNVGKGGIVKDPRLHINVINKIIANANDFQLNVQRLTFAPIVDSKKNIEYLALFSRRNFSRTVDVRNVVSTAFKIMKNK